MVFLSSSAFRAPGINPLFSRGIKTEGELRDARELLVLLRTVIGFVSMLIFTRILGKLEISQLIFFDYITGITIGKSCYSL